MTRIVTLGPAVYAGLKGHGSYWKMPDLWQRFHDLMNEHRLYLQGAQFMTILFDHAAEHIPFDERYWAAAMTIPDTADPETYRAAGMDIMRSVGGLYAVCIHAGPYDQIGDLWGRWRKDLLSDGSWELDSGRPSFEWYQNDSSSVPEELLLTLLCDPVIRC